MPRPSSPASPSLRYLAASDFELIVGGAGKHDLPQTNGNPLDPSAGFAAGGDSAVAPPVSSGAADGPGFTWPADMPDQLIDGGDADSAQDWDNSGAPMTLDGVDSITPYQVSSLPDQVAIDAAAGGGQHGCHDAGDNGNYDDTGNDSPDDSGNGDGGAQLGGHHDGPGHRDDGGAPHQAAPAPGGNEGSNVLDWAFSPRGPIAGASGGDLARDIWGMLGNLGDRLRR